MWFKYGLGASALYLCFTLRPVIFNSLRPVTVGSGRMGQNLRNLNKEPTLKSKACFKYLYFTKIISDLCCYLEYFSYLYTIN